MDNSTSAQKIIALPPREPVLRLPEDIVRRLARIDIEAALLGAIIIEPERYHEVADLVLTVDFTQGLHWPIYYAMKQIIGSGQACDITILSGYLYANYRAQLAQETQDDIKRVLTALCAACPNPANAVEYARIIRECGARMRMIVAARNTEMMAYDMTTGFEQVVDASTSQILKAAELVEVKPESLRDVMDAYLAELRAGGGRDLYVPCGLSVVDNNQAGLMQEAVTIVAGSTGQGKTTFGLGILAQLGATMPKGQFAATFSYEMNQKELTRYWLSMASGVWRRKLANISTISKPDLERTIQAGENNVRNWPIALYDNQMCKAKSANEARVKLRAHMAKTGLKPALVVMDGLWLASPSAGHSRDAYTDYRVIVDEWKALAGEFGCAVLIMHQFRLDTLNLPQGEKPNLSHLKGQGSASESADNVLGLYRQGDSNYLFHMKCRWGDQVQTPMQLGWDSKHSCYVDYGLGTPKGAGEYEDVEF